MVYHFREHALDQSSQHSGSYKDVQNKTKNHIHFFFLFLKQKPHKCFLKREITKV